MHQWILEKFMCYYLTSSGKGAGHVITRLCVKLETSSYFSIFRFHSVDHIKLVFSSRNCSKCSCCAKAVE